MTRRVPRKSYVIESDTDEEDDFEEESDSEEEEEDEEEDQSKEDQSNTSAEGQQDDDDDDDISSNDVVWKPCPSCKILSKVQPCFQPCPQPPLSIKILPNKRESYAKLFETVCKRGGYASLNADDWEDVRKEAGITSKRYRELYEADLWPIEKEQTESLLKQILKGTSSTASVGSTPKTTADDAVPATSSVAQVNLLAAASRKKERCGVCDGCLKDDCGACRFCKDKPKFGGRNSLKQACERKACTGPPAAQAVLEGVNMHDLKEPLATWQRALLTNALWGVRPRCSGKSNQQGFCQICRSDIRLLSSKIVCADCECAVACSACVTFSRSWFCRECLRDDAPSFTTLAICVGCGQAFSQSRTGQPCHQCNTSYCASCCVTDLRREPEEDGGGYSCFYCRSGFSGLPAIGLCTDRENTKRMKVLSLPI